MSSKMTASIRLPDFLIIGAMKAGTSTLQAQLAAQPGIFMTTPKEPNFFSDDHIYANGLPWYMQLFDNAGAEDILGEASTHYTKLPTYPQTLTRMGALSGAPRLVYIIRDPVERALSQYMHEWARGNVSHAVATAFAEHPEFSAYSRYIMQIEPYLDRFGLDAVLLTSLEALTVDPQSELSRIGAHIGCRQPLVWDHTITAQNVSAERVRPLPLHHLLVRNSVARTMRHALVPQSLRDRIKAARRRSEKPELPAGLRAELEKTFAPDHAALKELFPSFTALDLSYSFVTYAAA